MVQKVYKYETPDGKIFNTSKEAESHEAYISIVDQYFDHELVYECVYCERQKHHDLQFDDLYEWIKTHHELVKQILKQQGDK